MIKRLLVVPCLFIVACVSQPAQFRPTRRVLPPSTGTKTLPGTVVKNPPHMVPTPSAPPAATEVAAENNLIKEAHQKELSKEIMKEVAKEPIAPPAQFVEEVPDLLSLIKNPRVPRTKILEAINRETNLASIDKALEQPATEAQVQVYRPLLYYKGAQVAQKNRRLDLAMQYYRALTSQYPQLPVAAKANAEIALLQAAQEVDSKVIGAILPLTGKNANIGQHALNAIRLGLGLNKPNSNLRLAIFDSQSSAELAVEGVEKLVRDDKAIAIIGGLSSKEALAAAQKADLLSVPFIGLSQKAGLTTVGDYVFRNSLTAEMQVDRLVQYAFEKLGAKRFAVLYPNDAYGVEFANIYWDHVLARGGQMTAAQIYNPKENDFTTAIQKMVGTYYIEGRQEEYDQRVKDIALEKKGKLDKNKDKKVKPKNTRIHEVQENVLPPIVDFDVLFIPDTGKSLGQVMAFMKVNDVLHTTYLGTNIWNSPDLVKRAGTQTNQVYFVDALDMNDASIRQTPFFLEYTAAYNEEPALIEMQVFESAKILRDLLSSGSSSREAVASRLRILGRVPGVNGELRMSNSRELERPLQILSLETGLVKKVD
ncbi:MAG: penicillin-binding protein activator [Bdellovibrio sp.]|nr:penicillin-binding protein activator [Bdellovibrio sp.]